MENKYNIDLHKLYMEFDPEIITYKGPFHEHILNFIGRYIREVIKRNPLAKRKLFKVFMELAQNIGFYSEETTQIFDETKVGVGIVVICEFEECFVFHAGNIIKNEHAEILLNKCNFVNSLDREQLREFKRNQRGMFRGEKDGANIGLIQTVLTSENPIEVIVTPSSDNCSFFALAVRIEKQNEDVHINV